jgi:hypothetical protein
LLNPTDQNLHPQCWRALTPWLFNARPDVYLAGSPHEAYALIKDAEKALLWMQKRDMIKGEIAKLSQPGKSPGEIRLQGVYTP